MNKLSCFIVFVLVLFFANPAFSALSKGIYLTQYTAENTSKLNYLIREAKSVGINTFVVDLEKPSKKYQESINRIKNSGIIYVARIVVFPNGGTPDQITSKAYWEKKNRLIQQAVQYGADQIQLDYIRYNTKQAPSSQNAKNVHQVISWFKNNLVSQGIPLQIDVFGIASFGESKHIGHNIALFAKSIDVLCPMVYPSHYEPFRKHAITPYETVLDSLLAIKSQFKNKTPPFKLNPYIELSNYRYPLSQKKKLDYIYAQIRAVQNAGAQGWYAWSANNYYDNLFNVLRSYPVK